MSEVVNKLLITALSSDNEGERLNALIAASKKLKAQNYPITELDLFGGANFAPPSTGPSPDVLRQLEEARELRRCEVDTNNRIGDMIDRMAKTLARPNTKTVIEQIIASVDNAGENGVSLAELEMIKGFELTRVAMIISAGGAFWTTENERAKKTERFLVSERYRTEYPDAPPRKLSTHMKIENRVLEFGNEGVSRQELAADHRRVSELIAVGTLVAVENMLYHKDCYNA